MNGDTVLRRLLARGTLLALAATLMLAGCGGGSAGAASAAGAASTATASAGLSAFQTCLSQNGVKVTGTTAGAILAELRNSTGKTAAAVRTCRVLLQPAAPTSTPSS